MSRLSRTFLLRLLVLLTASTLVAAACSASDDDDEEGVDAVADEAEQAQTEEVEAGESAGEDIREAAGDPVHGGTLVYGIEADVANAWAPYGLTCSISCAMPLGAISDPLFDFDADGTLVPVLAEGIESNEEATEWTMTLREGVVMHDGEPFDATAVAYNINLCRASPQRGQDFLLVDDVEVVDDLTVRFILSQPWAAFPAAALDTPCGTHLMAPSWLKTLESNPLRTESRFTGTDLIDQETVDTEPTGDQAAPVSMGPFRFVSYTPGNGNGMVVERFEDYWRGDGPNSVTGEGLPYLDGIEFVITVDIASRSAGLQSGQFDIMHTANADEIAAFREEGDDFVRIEANKFGETNFFLINQADNDELDPEGANATNPLVDVRVRRALATAMDRDRLVEERGAGIVEAANGPFAPGQPGYLEDNGFPAYDPDAALALLQEYVDDPERSDGKAAGDPIAFEFNTTNDPFNVETNQLVAAMWEEAFGDLIDVTVTPIEQGQYVALAVAGEYEVQGWRQHGGADHDTQLRFWISDTVAPIGTPTFNFGRFHDPDLDELAAASRIETDPEVRIGIFEDMNRLFAEKMYYLPWSWTLWGIIGRPYVQDIAPLTTAEGVETFPVIAGAHSMTQMWCLEGVCE
ncbi:MAG: ABC transporter substrate-binding protein [Acidimicrobiales bacterium]